MGAIRCGKPVVRDSRTLVHPFEPTGECTRYFDGTELRVSYPVDISAVDEAILSIPLVANLCTVAWFTGSTLSVDVLETELVESLDAVKRGYEETFQNAGIGAELDGDVAVDERRRIEDSSNSGSQPAMLFTGGVDSTAAYLRRRAEAETPALLSVKREKRTDESWAEMRDNISDFAAYFDTDAYFLESNLERNMIDGVTVRSQSGLEGMGKGWWSGVQYPIGYTGLMAPLADAEGLSPIYEASGVTIEALSGVPAANPDIVHPFSWSDTRCRMVDFGLSRQEKIEYIVSNHESDWPFFVKSADEGTEKYDRTLVGFLAAGGDVADLGFDVDESYYTGLRDQLKQGPTEVSPASERMWREIQRKARRNKWSGPDYLYEAFEDADVRAHDKNYRLVQMYRKLPHPVDEFARTLYAALRPSS